MSATPTQLTSLDLAEVDRELVKIAEEQTALIERAENEYQLRKTAEGRVADLEVEKTKLENENSKLVQKIAQLEDPKVQLAKVASASPFTREKIKEFANALVKSGFYHPDHFNTVVETLERYPERILDSCIKLAAHTPAEVPAMGAPSGSKGGELPQQSRASSDSKKVRKSAAAESIDIGGWDRTLAEFRDVIEPAMVVV
jgi:hypothetical protein